MSTCFDTGLAAFGRLTLTAAQATQLTGHAHGSLCSHATSRHSHRQLTQQARSIRQSEPEGA